ncbi:hypothetical protein CANARDRAFT_30222 [[Candida] arabinofermentans NRRL YB-2248]|uniref:Large ribosomal subunit protein bL21m n=1 Tax=[Candida] arabinofermentans NRRL YB-2248 TaxID=983967 RepID=A0A1E4SUE3_9ASCO|nr:hypothetical protein CANARDRAFT_30222 [[Candida] arabinofermentans NRRL YB-2248]
MFTTPAARALRSLIIPRVSVRATAYTPLISRSFSSINSTTLQQQQQQQQQQQSSTISAATTTATATSINAQQQQTTQSSSIPDLTPLKFEKNLYATIKIHERPYLVTEGDEVILPFRMKHAEIGDILHFQNVTTVGSKNYTYHLDSSIDSSVVSIKGVVLEKTKKPMTVKEITKRRNRHTRHVKVKHDLTVLRITELKLNV